VYSQSGSFHRTEPKSRPPSVIRNESTLSSSNQNTSPATNNNNKTTSNSNKRAAQDKQQQQKDRINKTPSYKSTNVFTRLKQPNTPSDVKTLASTTNASTSCMFLTFKRCYFSPLQHPPTTHLHLTTQYQTRTHNFYTCFNITYGIRHVDDLISHNWMHN
jgi:hypothetical protein